MEPNPSILTNKHSLGILKKDTVFSAKILNPIIDTTYYVKAYAQLTNSAYFHSAEKTVRINSIKFSTDTAVVTPLLSAKIYGSFQNLGADVIQEYGFCYASSTSFPTLNDAKFSYNNPTLGIFTSNIVFQNYGTYYYRTYVIVNSKIMYGQVKSFEFK